MAVVQSIVVESRRYSGWIDPRYPIGYWQAALTVTGDASGGLLAIDLVFQGATALLLNSQMYSVERVGVTASNNVARVVSLAAVNMAGPANQGFLNQYAIAMSPHTHGGGSAINGDQLTFLPWFLGSQRTPAITASLSMITTNTDLIVFTFEAEGYRWASRSVLVDGGPQRPPTGPYGL